MAKSRSERFKSVFKNSNIFSRNRNRNSNNDNDDDDNKNNTPPPHEEAPPLPPPPSPPLFYICPISTSLMSDPVILPSGFSYERNFLLACIHLDFHHPSILLLSSLPPPSHPLTPNIALKNAIFHWCSHSHHPVPLPLPLEAALHLLKPQQLLPPPPPSSSHHQPEPDHSSISNALKKPSNVSSVVNALTSLLRDPPAPCTHQILDALAPCLHTLNERIQELAADLVCTLSLHPSNAAVLLKSQAVADLGVVLNTGTPHSRARAAEAVYNLVARSDEESSSRRLKIGALGLIRPLLKHFLDLGGRSVVVGPRKTALALWHLASREENVLIMVEIGAVERLVEVVWDERPATAEMRRYALVLMQCAMGSKMGREEFFDVGGMEVLLRRVRRKDCGEGRVGMHCLGVMYRVCRESMRRFREVADDVGAEEVLVEEMEEWGEEGKDWARAMVRVLKGEIQNAEEMKEVQVVMEDEDGRRDAKGKKKVDSE